MFNWPSNCVICGLMTPPRLALCQDCIDNLPWALKDNSLQLDIPKINTNLIISFYYKQPIKQFVTGLKFANHLLYAEILGVLLAKKLEQYYANKLLPEAIIPIPLHHERLRERGYNQSLEIARPIARKLNIKIDSKCYIRIKNTKAQAMTPARDRQKNIHNAFKSVLPIQYKHVAVIDDVVTTGNTLMEFCKTLAIKGIKAIDVWCCAKTTCHNFRSGYTLPELLSLLI